MKSIRIKKLRSLTDTNDVELKKITLLVGNNSSGKSTFLRVFPLLKQSFSKNTNGPVMWCGDENDYVDFGSFKESLNNRLHNESIDLCFKIPSKALSESTYTFGKTNFILSLANNEADVNIQVCIKSKGKTNSDYVSIISLDFLKYSIKLCFKPGNEHPSLVEIGKDKLSITENNNAIWTLGRAIFSVSLDSVKTTAYNKLIEILDVEATNKYLTNRRFHNDFDEIIDYLLCYRVLNPNREITSPIKIGIIDDYNIISTYDSLTNKDKVNNLIILYSLNNLFSGISDYISFYFLNSYYFAPIRATAERYYRLRNSAVNEIDCMGKNLAVFLYSLTNSNLAKYQEWTKKYLGFEVLLGKSEGHISIKIKNDGDNAINIADTGFGYSQLLPIITQLWYISNEELRRAKRNIRIQDIATVTIEQPEVHLHPALQAKLIDIITALINENNIRFVIETHSETIINRIGDNIARHSIDNEDVNILIFDKKNESETNVKFSKFDDEGYLEDWPIGFFSPQRNIDDI